MFGLGAPPAAKPEMALEEDWSDLDQPAQPAAIAPPPPMGSFGDELEVEPPAPKAPPAPIELPEEPEAAAEPELAPMHAFVPPPEKVGHKPAAPAPAPRATPPGAEGDGGEALLREALSKASLDVIERVVWEVVPQLAETIIKENLERLVRERQS